MGTPKDDFLVASGGRVLRAGAEASVDDDAVDDTVLGVRGGEEPAEEADCGEEGDSSGTPVCAR